MQTNKGKRCFSCSVLTSTSSEYLLKIQCVNTAWCTENSQIWSVGLGCVSHDFSAAPKSTKFFLFCRIFFTADGLFMADF